MKAFLVTLLVVASAIAVNAQKPGDWSRVYTFDESIIEMNTSNMVLGGNIGRVSFRWTFDRPETLPGEPQTRFKQKLETIEFRCADQLYRYYETSIVELDGRITHTEQMRAPYTWFPIRPGSVTATISMPACALINKNFDPDAAKQQAAESRKADEVLQFALSIKTTLERSRDIQQVVDKFFVPDFVNRYLKDDDANWFYNLDRSVAHQANSAELMKFYIAQLNAGYLTAAYILNQPRPADQDEAAPVDENVIPKDVYQVLNHHPYTSTYRSGARNYDYLADNIDTPARMRSYTDLLEKISLVMRKHVLAIPANQFQHSADPFDEIELGNRICETECLGLPKGTKVYVLTIPPLRFQFAEVSGKLRVIGATDSSH